MLLLPSTDSFLLYYLGNSLSSPNRLIYKLANRHFATAFMSKHVATPKAKLWIVSHSWLDAVGSFATPTLYMKKASAVQCGVLSGRWWCDCRSGSPKYFCRQCRWPNRHTIVVLLAVQPTRVNDLYILNILPEINACFLFSWTAPFCFSKWFENCI